MTIGTSEPLFDHLFDEAERVRWRMADLPWDRIDRAVVTPALTALVGEIAFSELTTHSATRRFLTEFADDTDLTRWIAVWFYEETKHPQVLLRWLAAVGVAVDDEFLRRGRATAPFMKSRMGTLATNIVSEMVAATGYARLAAQCREPVLARIAGLLAADEARHAASFYRYAARHLASSPDPERDRRDALKVLYLWFQDNERVAHPVNEFYGRGAGRADLTAAGGGLAALEVAPRERICRLFATLLDLPLDGASELRRAIDHLGDPARGGANP